MNDFKEKLKVNNYSMLDKNFYEKIKKDFKEYTEDYEARMEFSDYMEKEQIKRQQQQSEDYNILMEMEELE